MIVLSQEEIPITPPIQSYDQVKKIWNSCTKKINLTISSFIKLLPVGILFLLSIWSPILTSASNLTFATDAGMNKQNTDDAALAGAEIFAIGMVGFVGHISAGEAAYRKILKESDAKSRFYSIYKSSTSTNAAKLYSACGLKALSSPKFQEINRNLKTSKEQVTTMKADVMRKEAVSEIIERIDHFGC